MTLVFLGECIAILFLICGLAVAFRAFLEIPSPNVKGFLLVALILIFISLVLVYAFDMWGLRDWLNALWQ